MTLGILFLCLLLGGVIGWRRLLPRRVLGWSGKAMMLGVFFLLLTMGMKIGVDRETLRQMGVYGLQALGFAVASVTLSIGIVWGVERWFVPTYVMSELEIEIESSAHPYRMTVMILVAFVIGIILGIFVFPTEGQRYLSQLTNGALDFTLFAVGLDLGMNQKIWKQIFHLGWHVFLAPLGVIVGSIAAGMLAGKLLGWTFMEGGAVGAGFGWYSLSGVLISEMHSVRLGTIAFLSNVLRELLSILLVPLLARRVGPLTLVAPGGATTMDTTLPLIAAAGPPEVAVIAFVNGICLSALVPVLVPLFLGR